MMLHALNAVLVFAVARLCTGSRAVALVAGLAFSTFDLAFTAVFWVSGVQDLLAVAFLLTCALIWAARAAKGPIVSIASAGALALSLLSKEIGVLFPAVLALVAWAQGSWSRRTATALIPHAAISVAAGALFLTQGAKIAEGGAYGSGFSTDIAHNLATYVAWTADIVHPFKDRLAVIDPGAWRIAAPAGALAALFLFTFKGRRARMAWAFAGWYALALAPVLPLLHHTYLYYLYPASAGAAILLGLAADRIGTAISHGRAALPRRESAAPGATPVSTGAGYRRQALGISFTAVVAATLCVTGFMNVRARERTYLPPDFVLPHDHVLRAAELARNSASTFSEAAIPLGADLLLINPFAPASVDLSEGAAPEAPRVTTDMVRAALREGDVLKLLRPDLGDISFSGRMEPAWENRHGFLYNAYGKLTYVGTGADIWANLSTVHLQQTKNLEESIRCSRRALELRPDHPRAALNLGIALAMEGSVAEAREHLARAAATLPSESLRRQAQSWLDSLR